MNGFVSQLKMELGAKKEEVSLSDCVVKKKRQGCVIKGAADSRREDESRYH